MTHDERKALEEMVRTQIEIRGVREERVLGAMRSVPRMEFVPEEEKKRATGDFPLPIGEEQTISQPYVVAAMTEAILEGAPLPCGRVLEIGTGSGYQAAVLAEIFDRVYTVERIPSLSERARERLSRLGYKSIYFRVGNGCSGWPEEGPYEAIVVTAAASEIPPALLEQMAVNGRMVIPVGGRYSQDLLLVERTPAGYRKRSLFGVRFVELINHN